MQQLSVTQRAQRMIRNLGFTGAARYLRYRQLDRPRCRHRAPSAELTTRYSAHPLSCRWGTSDRDVFHQIFIEREYAAIDDLADAQLIIDCGANIGCATAYLATRFPRSHVIAVEPDDGNFAMLKQNSTRFGGRVTPMQAAVWSHCANLVFSEERWGDAKDWAVQVREALPHELAQVKAVDIGTLLENSGFERISILKIDIEGSEAQVFSHNYETWIDRVDCILIEVHGPQAQRALSQAVKDQPFEFVHSGEITVCRRKTRCSPVQLTV